MPEVAIGDAARLRQILVNLVSNAVKFTPSGGVTVSTEAGPVDEHGQLELCFHVRDSGIGIPADKLPLLFQSFTQVDAGTSRRYGGSGLGLAICKRLCERMGGTIGVKSEPGVGSTFAFSIRVSVDRPLMSVRPSALHERLRGRRVLVVGEFEAGRQILVEQLKRWGIATTEARDAEEAFGLATTRPFDLVCLDLTAPGASLALMGRLRDLEFPLPPAIIFSPLGTSVKGADGPNVAVLNKPYRQVHLLDALARVFLPESGPTLSPNISPIDTASSERGHVLVVEDNAVNQKVVCEMLRRLGCRTDSAANGREAVEAVKRRPYSFILMDVSMPVMDGYEATERIRGLDIDVQPMICGLTANATQADRDKCFAAGMDRFLAKPLHLNELRDLVEAALVPVTPTFEPKTLERFRRELGPGAEELVRQIVELYLVDSPTLLERMRQAVEGDNPADLRRGRAHAERLERRLRRGSAGGGLF